MVGALRRLRDGELAAGDTPSAVRARAALAMAEPVVASTEIADPDVLGLTGPARLGPRDRSPRPIPFRPAPGNDRGRPGSRGSMRTCRPAPTRPARLARRSPTRHR